MKSQFSGSCVTAYTEGKATWPGRKQVFRVYGDDGRLAFDELGLDHERTDGTPLIVPAGSKVR